MLNQDGHPVLARTLDIAMRGLMPVRKRIVPWAQGRVLEIGCGTGANFPLYGDISALVGVEPDPHMRKRAIKAASACSFPVEVVDQSATSLAFESGSFDTVVATFVLCTIDDPGRAAQEMFRVLKPDGLLIFAEHVGAEHRLAHGFQKRATPLWSKLAGGCRLDNPALAQLDAAGFALELQSPARPAYDVFPVVYGFGRKGVLA